MRGLVLALLPFALADQPTPKPTITPAPQSDCLYEDTDNGPFALDCLQATFIERGCSMRGLAYPTEAKVESEGDKALYNGATWKDFLDHVDALETAACRGTPTAAPTPDPTASPVTKSPTNSPTAIETTLTPAPTYNADYRWIPLVDTTTDSFSDAADAAAEIKAACETAGFARQYDATQYVVKLTMGIWTDYYTFEPEADGSTGQYTSVCDMLNDPVTNVAMWSDQPEGPFWAVDLSEGTKKTPDQRSYPSWLDSRGDDSGKGYGTATTSTTPGGSIDYELSISSRRSFSPCVERVDPNSDFEAPCGRSGANGQDFSGDATACDDADEAMLLYAIANKMFATCDDVCVYHPDYTEDLGASDPRKEYWEWQQKTSDSCWKPASSFGASEFKPCDTSHTSFDADYATAYAFVQKRQATLCSERCDYVNGWEYLEGSCYKSISYPDYEDTAGSTNPERADTECAALSDGNGGLASIGSANENDAALSVCTGSCYLGNDASKFGEADGTWLDGTPIVYANWKGGYEGASHGDEGDNYLALDTTDGTWEYTTDDKLYEALCETAANNDETSSNEAQAMTCMSKESDNTDNVETSYVPELDIDRSGFTDAENPGVLHLFVNIPKYYYDAHLAFENSTNDVAEHSWGYSDTYWTVNENSANCDEPMEIEGAIPWTVFNLGGAGGVQRLSSWQTFADGASAETDTETDLADDGWENSKYLFGSVIRMEAKQPVFTSVDIDNEKFAKREATYTRRVTARIPFILQFQKTVTVTTDVDIISTKFNYKTVAAIIQSIQFDTQYFEPPYAKIRMQIRTKSQYPYLFDTTDDSWTLIPETTGTSRVAMAMEHLYDDRNCTFTNSDHMREGDVCTQEWLLTLTPGSNVCYATGEYTVEFKAGCFYGKDVCYLPTNADDDDIETVSFTFKVQTSKFCPVVADEVDLRGTLSVTGRQSFKPDEESVEDNTEGSFYLQGETVHLFATTHSDKAVITNTAVVMVELEQNLEQLVMTGYNRVPYDEKTEEVTIWSEPGDNRVATGTISIAGDSGSSDVVLMTDDDVFASGTSFEDSTGAEVYNFADNEAGFKILLHAKAFPVNVDSFDSKTLLATLEVEYEALNNRRRRLLATSRTADLRSRADFRLDSWKPSIGAGHTDAASMSMELTLQHSSISRGNVRAFVQSFEDAIITAMKMETVGRLYEQQVVVEAVYSKDKMIWTRPTNGDFNTNKRKLLAITSSQKLRVEFTMVSAPAKSSVPLQDMLTIFDKQLRSPSSPLMRQPIFYGSVIHNCVEIESSSYRMVGTGYDNPTSEIESEFNLSDVREESSAFRSLPVLAALLLVALW